MKSIIAFVLALQTSFCYAQDTLLEWDNNGSHYTIVEQSDRTNSPVLTHYNDIAYQYHIDHFNKLSEDERPSSKDEFINRVQGYTKVIEQKYLSGHVNLLLVYKDSDLLGGTYYGIEKEAHVARIYATGLKTTLSAEEKSLTFSKMFEILTNPEKFPEADKLVIVSRSYNKDNKLFGEFGFIPSSYQAPGFDMSKYEVFEKPFQ